MLLLGLSWLLLTWLLECELVLDMLNLDVVVGQESYGTVTCRVTCSVTKEQQRQITSPEHNPLGMIWLVSQSRFAFRAQLSSVS
jgi:hypothetical protein